MIGTGDVSTTLINPGSYSTKYIHPFKEWSSTIIRDGTLRENGTYFFFKINLYYIES